MTQRQFKINLMGDVMIGRLIDQMLPSSVDEQSEADIVRSFKSQNYTVHSPWGTALPLLNEADLNLINLETAMTTHPVKWPEKVFNYRCHPANIDVLKVAGISYAGLANNHTLDFSEPGLSETVRTVREAGITLAGAGKSREEATRPAVLKLPKSNGKGDHHVHVWAASDHPSEWSSVESFHFINYTDAMRARLKELLTRPTAPQPALKIFSVHWGPNYAWQPAPEIRDLAHFLVDECGVDIVHGHSSHHVQGVEAFKGKLIIYGCGDFVDDYALNAQYRNDLGGVWRVLVEERPGVDGLAVKGLEMYPTKIERFKAIQLNVADPDSRWVREKVSEWSAELGTPVKPECGRDGQLELAVPSLEEKATTC